MEMLELIDRLIVINKNQVIMDGPKDEVIARLSGGAKQKVSIFLNKLINNLSKFLSTEAVGSSSSQNLGDRKTTLVKLTSCF
jgi:ABC-type multidrug transport system ATPase subunit